MTSVTVSVRGLRTDTWQPNPEHSPESHLGASTGHPCPRKTAQQQPRVVTSRLAPFHLVPCPSCPEQRFSGGRTRRVFSGSSAVTSALQSEHLKQVTFAEHSPAPTPIALAQPQPQKAGASWNLTPQLGKAQCEDPGSQEAHRDCIWSRTTPCGPGTEDHGVALPRLPQLILLCRSSLAVQARACVLLHLKSHFRIAQTLGLLEGRDKHTGWTQAHELFPMLP